MSADTASRFADDAPATVLEIVATLQRLMVCEHLIPDIRNEARGEIPNQCVSSAKAREVLGWSANYSRDEALKETIDWYCAYFDVPVPDAAPMVRRSGGS